MMNVCLPLMILLGNIAGRSTDECPLNFIKLNNKCSPLIGGNCNNNDDCVISNTKCDKVCRCNDGMHLSEDKTFCETNIKKIGDSCEYYKCDTIKNAVCKLVNNTMLYSSRKDGNTEYKCQCKPNHYQRTTGCVKFATDLTDTCEDSIGCRKITGTNCNKTSNTCQCKEKSFYLAEGKCHKKAKGLGGECKNDAGCTKIENAECPSKTCECKTGYYKHEKKCLARAKNLGESCKNDDGCPDPNIMQCAPDGCQCKDTHYKDNKSCLLKAQSLGNRCKNDNGCLNINNAICNTEKSVCECKNGYYEHENECLVKAENLGEGCKNENGCKTLFASCSNKICSCKKNYVPYNGVCYGFLNAQCQEHKNCFTTSYYCKDSTCQNAENSNEDQKQKRKQWSKKPGVKSYWIPANENGVKVADSVLIGKSSDGEMYYLTWERHSKIWILKGPVEWRGSNFTFDTAIFSGTVDNGQPRLSCRVKNKEFYEFGHLKSPLYDKCQINNNALYDQFEVLVEV